MRACTDFAALRRVGVDRGFHLVIWRLTGSPVENKMELEGSGEDLNRASKDWGLILTSCA